MTPEEIQAMAKGLAEGQALWYLLSAVIGGAIAGLGGYLAEKGKNRATKEDIATITREVEQVRAEFTNGVEDLKAHHQLRMVAAERRLQAHQEAYERCIGFIEGINFSEDAWTKLRNENERWHRKNYIFLGKKTRKSFAESLHACVRFRATRKVSDLDLSKSPEERAKDYQQLKSIWNDEILPVLQHITSEVNLPELGSDTPPPPA